MTAPTIKIWLLGVVTALLLLASQARAGDFEDGETAYKAKDYGKAYQLLKPESDRGILKAQALLARMYASGLGTAKDVDAALNLARLAASKGSPEACFFLGNLYGAGSQVPKNNEEALKWYRIAAENGNMDAQRLLGAAYLQGNMMAPRDYAEALKWTRMAAAQGDPNSQTNLGYMYFSGKGLQQDYVEAMKWYRLAADQGNPGGLVSIGELFELGRGVKQDYREATRWYLLAAEKSPTIAQRVLEKPEIKAAAAQLQAEAATQRQREQEEQPRQSQAQPTATAQPATPPVGKRVALVIGNAAYKVHPLRNPRNDADDVSRSLKGSGFEVIDLRDASLIQMRSAIRQFGDKLLASDTGLVYYSGHGIEIRGRNYFIPVNADIQREDEVSDQSLDVALILEKMGTAQKAVNILIVDACRDDPFGRSFRSSSKGLASMEAPRGTIVAYATSPGKVAADGAGRNSPYTKHLVRAMQAPNKPIELVFKEVRRAVQDETKNLQTPWENTSLSGDFYFRVQK